MPNWEYDPFSSDYEEENPYSEGKHKKEKEEQLERTKKLIREKRQEERITKRRKWL